VRRQIVIIVFIAQLFFFLTIHGFAQQTPDQNPSIPDDVLGSQLIAWSLLQKPEPVMQSQSQERLSPSQVDEPSSPAQTFFDRSGTDRANQDGKRFVPIVTNHGDRPEQTIVKH
jgi:hypothetical protein